MAFDGKATEKTLVNLRRRVDRARNFPHNTCPQSRHLHVIADTLMRYGDYPYMRDDPKHVALALYSVLEDLFKLRTALAKQAAP